MKNILLVGDSIRMGYDKAVQSTLEGAARVYFPPENCRFASYVLRYLHEYKALTEGRPVDILHWNAGLWDCLRLFGEDPHTPLEVYTYYIDRICQRIQKLFPEAKVIFATCTSVQEDRMQPDFKRFNRDIEAYNAAAVEVVSRYGFAVNDLYSVSVALPPEAHSDPVHYYTPLGTRVFTQQVLDRLLPLLELDHTPQYREEMFTGRPSGI